MAVFPNGVKATIERYSPRAQSAATIIRDAKAQAKRDGLRVVMRRIPGLTPPNLLRKPFTFQAPPLEEIAREMAFTFSEIDALGGTLDRPVSRALTTISFDTLFVDYQAPWVVAGDRYDTPLSYLDELEQILDAGRPFRLVIHQARLWGRPDVDMAATLRSVRPSEKHGEPDARYVAVSFTEHRSSLLQSTTKLGTDGTVRGNDKTPATVKVKDDGGAIISPNAKHPDWGDGKRAGPVTMYKLARFFYGEHGKWVLIAGRNGLTVGPSRPLNERGVLRNGVVQIPRDEEQT